MPVGVRWLSFCRLPYRWFPFCSNREKWTMVFNAIDFGMFFCRAANFYLWPFLITDHYAVADTFIGHYKTPVSLNRVRLFFGRLIFGCTFVWARSRRLLITASVRWCWFLPPFRRTACHQPIYYRLVLTCVVSPFHPQTWLTLSPWSLIIFTTCNLKLASNARHFWWSCPSFFGWVILSTYRDIHFFIRPLQPIEILPRSALFLKTRWRRMRRL